MNGFLYIIAAFVAFIVVTTVVYQIRLGRHRGVAREAFIQEFRKQGISDDVPAAVYDYYKSSSISRHFTVSPDDSYGEVFHEEREDIDDDAKRLAQQLGLVVPIEPILRKWDKPVDTLRDMVFWLNWIRQQQNSKSSG